MTTLKDILLELRAIRLGFQYQLYLTTGKTIDLVADASRQETELTQPGRRKPRDHTAILHRNDEAAAARETLAEMGDDTLAMIEYVRTEISEEAAEGMRRFYEEEIVGKR